MFLPIPIILDVLCLYILSVMDYSHVVVSVHMKTYGSFQALFVEESHPEVDNCAHLLSVLLWNP